MLFVLAAMCLVAAGFSWAQQSEQGRPAAAVLTPEEVRLLDAAAALPRGEGPLRVCRSRQGHGAPVATVSLGSRGPEGGMSLGGLSNGLLQLYPDETVAARAVDRIAFEAERARDFGYDEAGMPLVTPVALRTGPLVLLLPHDTAAEDVSAHRGSLEGVKAGAGGAAPASAEIAVC